MKVIVIGGGPSGMMAAIVAAQSGAEVVLIDGNESLGKKLGITGNGRCNVTNNADVECFLNNVVTNGKFLYSALNRFSPADTVRFFEEAGVKLKVERGGRVFPESDRASDVVSAMRRLLAEKSVEVVFNQKVQKVSKNDCFIVKTDNKMYKSDKLVIATGGVSFSKTGSTGDGCIFAEELGHKVMKPVPALVPVDLLNFNSSLAGISLKDVKVNVTQKGKSVASVFGELLFTHTGVSGPAVLCISSYVNKMELNDAVLSVDLFPTFSTEQLEKKLLEDFKSNINKDFVNYLNTLIPKGMTAEFMKRLSFEGNKKINVMTRENRIEIIKALKSFDFRIKGLKDIDVGMVTSGGVDVKQVDSATMQSKKVDGLFFAGEVLDVDALTGGYNVQIALSTGYVAGMSCCL